MLQLLDLIYIFHPLKVKNEPPTVLSNIVPLVLVEYTEGHRLTLHNVLGLPVFKEDCVKFSGVSRGGFRLKSTEYSSPHKVHKCVVFLVWATEEETCTVEGSWRVTHCMWIKMALSKVIKITHILIELYIVPSLF